MILLGLIKPILSLLHYLLKVSLFEVSFLNLRLVLAQVTHLIGYLPLVCVGLAVGGLHEVTGPLRQSLYRHVGHLE